MKARPTPPSKCSRTRRDRLPDALFGINDIMSMGAIDALRYRLGIRVPEELMVGASTTSPRPRREPYRLTTVRQPIDEMVDETLSILHLDEPDLPIERGIDRPIAGRAHLGRHHSRAGRLSRTQWHGRGRRELTTAHPGARAYSAASLTLRRRVAEVEGRHLAALFLRGRSQRLRGCEVGLVVRCQHHAIAVSACSRETSP